MNLLHILIEVNFDLTSINEFIWSGDLLHNIINKKDILYWFNIFNFLHYVFYKWIKIILIKFYYYFIQFFIIFVYPNMSNKFLKSFIINFFIVKLKILTIKKFIMIRIIKKKRFYKNYYRFHKIDYLKFIFFIFFFALFFLIWKRRNTYFKRSFVIILVKYYVLTMLLSGILVPLISNTFIGINLSLLIVFIYLYLKLN